MARFIIYLLLLLSLIGCDFFTDPGDKKLAKKDSISLNNFRPLSPNEMKTYRESIEKYYNARLLGTGFNGSILVAKNGIVLFEDYHGTFNFTTDEPITEHSAFHLASISKTFTSAAVLKLWEEGRLSLDDTLQHFFPDFPYPGITVKTLLNHRSGLPNYLYFMDSLWDKKQKATNEDVLQIMILNKPPVTLPPDKRYQYCNTNYVLLAMIIEKITKQSFPRYMKDSVFMPLGLKDTYVFCIKDTLQYNPTYSVTRPFLMDHLDCTYGDKNIYSTARDLLQWDQVLYSESYLSKATLELAFTPFSHEVKTMHNYGLGWHLFFHNGDTVIYHNGKWHGSNTVFTRLVQDTATIIVLGNKVNRNIYGAKEISGIFSGTMDTNSLEE